MKIAIVHEMLVKLGGAENVVLDLMECFPEADLYTMMYDEKKVGKKFPKEKVHVAKKTQKIYSLFWNQRLCLPFMARAVESLDLMKYDLIISSSSGFAHGCITSPDSKHIVYYHSPARYLWDWTHEYRKEIGWNKGIKNWILSRFFSHLRKWDYLASQRHDISIAASVQVEKRIMKYYRRKSTVLYPPVEIKNFSLGEKKLKERQYYINTSALTEFKRIDILIDLFNENGLPLYIVGDGAARPGLEKKAKKNIQFLGRKNHAEISELYKNARGFIMPGRDDFGIAPVEAMASGIPVFAYELGGLLETNVDGITGRFFPSYDLKDIVHRFSEFDKEISEDFYNPKKIRDRAEVFSKEKFLLEVKKFEKQDINYILS